MNSPRGFQYGFTALFLLDLGVRLALGSSLEWPSWPAASLGLVLVLLVATPLVPASQLSRASVALAVIDLAAVGMSRLTDEGGIGILLVMPALWLGRAAGRRGVVVSAVATALLVSLPAFLYFGSAPTQAARSVLYPVLATVAAMAMAVSMSWVRRERAEVEHQRDRLAEALDTIAHERRVSEAVFDSVDVGLVLLDRHGRYAGVNRRQRQFMLLGFPDGHVGEIGQLGEVYDIDGRTPLSREEMPSYRAFHGEEYDHLRMWIGPDPATRRALSVSARIVKGPDGSFAGAALAYTDVTDLMDALEVKDEFVALVSHELRTPLTSIVGYSQLLEDEPGLPERAQRHLTVIQRNAERLRRLIGDLLDVAQRDRGVPLSIERAPVDLAALVRESLGAAAAAAEAAGIAVHYTGPDTVIADLDGQRIAQVVDNLVSNAVKYTESGGRVAVSLTVHADEVCLEVSDTGIGIEEADLDRLFGRFFRSAEAERRAVAGAGLGLAITKDIVEGHGGRIDVSSRVGHGSTFRICLPLSESGAQPMRQVG